MNGDGVEILVTPEILDEKAEEVKNISDQMEQIFEDIQNKVDRTRSYWVGEAADAHREAFKKQKTTINDILKRLREHPVDLQKIAKTYRGTEQALEEGAMQMSSNLIE